MVNKSSCNGDWNHLKERIKETFRKLDENKLTQLNLWNAENRCNLRIESEGS
jgi:hypothetical protein